MKSSKNNGSTVWLILFILFLLEQTLIPVLAINFDVANSPANKNQNLYQVGQASDLQIEAPRSIGSPVPAMCKAEPVKFKFHPTEWIEPPVSVKKRFSEYIQDVWRCPTVAILLFPYHEFL